MTKTELTQLTQVIEQLVKREIRKQLPTLIAETFQNMMGKGIIDEKKQTSQSNVQPEPHEEITDLKSSLKEMFAEVPVAPAPKVPQRRFSKNPILNEILNQTPSLRAYERSAGAYTPAMAMMGDLSSNVDMVTPEISFAKPIPPVSLNAAPQLQDGQISNHAPLAEVPPGVSVLDVARQMPLPGSVGKALTMNYAEKMKKVNQAVNARKGLLT